MSLFKLRDAWSQRFPGEEFETRGMCIADLLSRADQKKPSSTSSSSKEVPPEQIILGGFKGVLRVLCPMQRTPQSEDLLLEYNVGGPILQVAAAPVSAATHNSIIVLCPRKMLILDVSQHDTALAPQPPRTIEISDEDDEDRNNDRHVALDNLGAGHTYKVTLVAELMQQRTAHSFTTGLFGRPPNGVHGICVQSMDGNLDFYSGRHLSFNRFLPSASFLVPGALLYVQRCDAFFVSTASLEVECYSFATLAGATGSADPSRAGAGGDNNSSQRGGGGGRKLSPDWTFVVGEDVISMKECRLLSATSADEQSTDVAVLAEHSFLLLNSKTGQPTMNIRLDYHPMCMAVFPHPKHHAALQQSSSDNNNSSKATPAFLSQMNNLVPSHQVIICSSTGSYFVHSDKKIVWSAKGTVASGSDNSASNLNLFHSAAHAAAPICVEVSVRTAHCKAHGMIVVLSDDGSLSVNYLGTDHAASQSLQLLQRDEMDVQAAVKENAELQQKIQAGLGATALVGSNSGSAAAASVAAKAQLETNSSAAAASAAAAGDQQVELQWDPLELSVEQPRLDNREGLAHVDIYVKFPGPQDLQNVTIVIAASDPVAASQHTHTLAFLPGRSRIAIPASFGIKPELRQIIPSSLHVDVVASYNTAAGRAVISRATIDLPLALVCRPVPQIKNAPCKLQVDVMNRANGVPPVDQLFSDIAVYNSELVTPNVLSVHLSNGLDATVLLSKNGSRYRVQSSHFAGLWLLASELVKRLRRVLSADGGPQPPNIELPDEVPLVDLARVIDYHFEARQQLQGAQRAMGRVSEQLRAVQRRLIARYREENPAPMRSMQQLFEVTYRGMREACDRVERCTLELKGAAAALGCGVSTTLLVVEAKMSHLGAADMEVLRSVLSPAVEDGTAASAEEMSSVGWEETTVTGLTHLLRTTLSKQKGGDGGIVAQPLAVLADTSKVHKSLQMVLERLLKGARLVDLPRPTTTGGQD